MIGRRADERHDRRLARRVGITLRADALGVLFAALSSLAAARRDGARGPRGRPRARVPRPGAAARHGPHRRVHHRRPVQLLRLLRAGDDGGLRARHLRRRRAGSSAPRSCSRPRTSSGRSCSCSPSPASTTSPARWTWRGSPTRMADVDAEHAAILIAVGFFVAFSVKLGLFPFHFWLPTVYTGAGPAVAAILSGGLANIGAYGLLRFGAEMLPRELELAARPADRHRLRVDRLRRRPGGLAAHRERDARLLGDRSGRLRPRRRRRRRPGRVRRRDPLHGRERPQQDAAVPHPAHARRAGRRRVRHRRAERRRRAARRRVRRQARAVPRGGRRPRAASRCSSSAARCRSSTSSRSTSTSSGAGSGRATQRPAPAGRRRRCSRWSSLAAGLWPEPLLALSRDAAAVLQAVAPVTRVLVGGLGLAGVYLLVLTSLAPGRRARRRRARARASPVALARRGRPRAAEPPAGRGAGPALRGPPPRWSAAAGAWCGSAWAAGRARGSSRSRATAGRDLDVALWGLRHRRGARRDRRRRRRGARRPDRAPRRTRAIPTRSGRATAATSSTGAARRWR